MGVCLNLLDIRTECDMFVLASMEKFWKPLAHLLGFRFVEPGQFERGINPRQLRRRDPPKNFPVGRSFERLRPIRGRGCYGRTAVVLMHTIARAQFKDGEVSIEPESIDRHSGFVLARPHRDEDSDE